MSEGIICDVRTIGSGVRNIVSYAGLKDTTYALVAKSIIFGASRFDEAHWHLRGNVVSRRAEAVYIGQALNQVRKELPLNDATAVANRVLPQRKLEELAAMKEYDSVLLPPLMNRLRGVKPDYQADRLMRYGEQVIAYFSANRSSGPMDGQFNVDIPKLGNAKVSLELKRLFRDLKSLEELAYQL